MTQPQPITIHLWKCACGQQYALEEYAAACCVCRRCGGANARRLNQLCSDCFWQHRASRVANVPESLYGEKEFAVRDDADSPCEIADSWDEVCEQLECPEGCDASHGAYAITRSKLRLSAEDILEDEGTEWHEDALENVDAADLQARLDEWCEAENVTGWSVDDRTRVLPDDVCRRWVDALDVGMRRLMGGAA